MIHSLLEVHDFHTVIIVTLWEKQHPINRNPIMLTHECHFGAWNWGNPPHKRSYGGRYDERGHSSFYACALLTYCSEWIHIT